MKRTRLRSGLLTGALVILAAVAWLYLGPTNIGGSTSYVITRGISMEPQFHTGDLALVRPADHYKVGEIVAYHSTVLDSVVLHRIIARQGDRYVFKGDNNNFVDPDPANRAQLIGALWLHIPHGGRVLALLHTPLAGGLVTAVVALLLLVGVKETRRRRNHRRSGATGSGRQGPPPVKTFDHGASRHINLRAPLIACAVTAAAFLGLGVFSFTRPLRRPATVSVPYTQGVSFGYQAKAPAGPVYPDGVVHTGDPIFLQLVHRVRVRIDYHFATSARHRVAGTEAVLLRLAGPGGWSRTTRIAPPQRFTGDHFSTQVTLDVPYLQSLIARIQTLTGVSTGGGFTIALATQVQISGTVAGQAVKTSFGPTLSLQLNPLQLTPGAGSTSSGTAQSGLSPNKRATVATAATAPNPFKVLGHPLAVATLRWVALLGFLLSAASVVVLAVRLKLSRPVGEAARIQAQYGHLIVPIEAASEDRTRPPIDVTNIKALVQLAECSERLILHHHDESADTYLVEDEGTVYRYRAQADGQPRRPSPAARPAPSGSGSRTRPAPPRMVPIGDPQRRAHARSRRRSADVPDERLGRGVPDEWRGPGVPDEWRGPSVPDELRGPGVPDDLPPTTEVPAGVANKARTPAEVALSILAKTTAK